MRETMLGAEIRRILKTNATAAWRKIKWRDLLPCAGYFCIFPKLQLFFFKKCNLITFSPRCVKTKLKILLFHHYSFINNYFEIEIHNSQWDPRDKPGFNSLPKPTFKLCFLCGVVKTCLPWNFIAFLNLKCWWEWEKGNIGIFSRNKCDLLNEISARYSKDISCISFDRRDTTWTMSL